MTPAASMHVTAVDTQSFESVVVEGSRKIPVVVDFWAPWCAPCRALTPILEKLATEYDGAFLLAKVNADENPELTARYHVRGIPAVKAFVDGSVAEEFTGAQPENAVREFLQRLVPSPVEGLRSDAYRVYAQTGNVDQALEALAQAERLDPANDDIRIDRVALLVNAGRHDEARAAIGTLRPLSQMDERITGLMAKLDLTRAAADAPSEDTLTQRLAADANDLEARLQLAHLHVARGAYREALEELLQIIRADRRYRDDIARKTTLQVFELLGNEGELVSEFRRKLASAMN